MSTEQQIGSESEAYVAFRLIQRGYRPFIPFAHTAVGFDFLVLAPSGSMFRVTVRTSRPMPVGSPCVSLHRSNGRKSKTIQTDEYDILIGVNRLTQTCFIWNSEELRSYTRAVAESPFAKEAWEKLPS